MNSLSTNSLQRSKYFMLSIALVLATALSRSNAQELRQGVSVHLAATTNAASMPDADNQDAWIVAVTADGSLYFGIDPVTPGALADKMKSLPRIRDQKLYIKADARAPFADVERVVAVGHEVWFESAVFLTSQPESPAPGTMVPPKGLEVSVGPMLPAGTVATVIELFNSGQQRIILKINNDQVSWSALQSTLRQHFQKGDERVILLKADGQLPFADVAHVIDACRSVGAKIALAAPSL
jgi:biopolymer transport protein ExbD